MLVLCPFVMHAQVPDPCSTSNLGGVAWMDNDYDGAVDANELQKVEGITVQIYDCNGDLVGTDVTDVNGDWHYDGTLTYPVELSFRILKTAHIQLSMVPVQVQLFNL